MKIVIIGHDVYKVSDNEFKPIQELRKKIKSTNYPENYELEQSMGDYLDANKHKYTYVGSVDYDYRY